MAQQNITTLQTNINTQLADNTAGDISAADVRNNLINITDSLLFNSGSQGITGSLSLSDNLVVTGSITVNGNSNLGNAVGDRVFITGSIRISGSTHFISGMTDGVTPGLAGLVLKSANNSFLPGISIGSQNDSAALLVSGDNYNVNISTPGIASGIIISSSGFTTDAPTTMSGSVNVTGSLSVTGSIVPGDNIGTLGTAAKPWKDLYLSNSTLYFMSGSTSSSFSVTSGSMSGSFSGSMSGSFSGSGTGGFTGSFSGSGTGGFTGSFSGSITSSFLTGSCLIGCTGSIIPTGSAATEGYFTFVKDGSNYWIYVYLGGAWRSGSLS